MKHFGKVQSQVVMHRVQVHSEVKIYRKAELAWQIENMFKNVDFSLLTFNRVTLTLHFIYIVH